MKKNTYNSGFSLIELAVTLVIIGIIIGGITAGSHLLQAAKINRIISQVAGYAEAIENFQQKYKAWPGDMPNATSFWGIYNDPANLTGTVNGDGDELIEGDLTERLRSWQQLALSGFITGSYTGVDAGTPDHQGDVNLPAGTIKASHFYVATGAQTFYGAAIGSTYLQFAQSDASTSPYSSVISPEDSRAIDNKADDGLADSGVIFALRGVNNQDTAGKCVTNKWDQATSVYVLTDDDTSCRIFFWLDKL